MDAKEQPRRRRDDPWPNVPEARRRVMRANKGTDTKPELAVRSLLHSLGYRFRLHRKDLPGSPDLVFPSRRKVVFVHGCYWHGHEGCKRSNTPKTNAGFWNKKIETNRARDTKSLARLEDAGWRSMVIWECELVNPASVVKRSRDFLGAPGGGQTTNEPPCAKGPDVKTKHTRKVTAVGPAKKDEAASPHREVWSFFSGAMGLDLGLEQAGLHVTLANEIDPAFCKTIRMNRPGLDLIEGDVKALTGKSLRQHRKFDGEVYLMVGGPPCQAFSSGGKRAALSDPRGNLIYEFIRLVAEVRPRYFVLENVANLTTAALRHRPISLRPGKHWNLRRYEDRNLQLDDGALPLDPDEMAGSALKQVLADVSSLGYHVSFRVVDAADFGAPQHRLRFVMMGSRDYPPPELLAPTHGVGGHKFVTVRDAIEHLAEKPGAHSEYTAPVLRFFDLVPPGGNWRSLPKDLQAEALGGAFESGGGKTGFYRRLSWDAPAPTITGRANRKGSAMCHPASSRPLSVLECAALQGFPSSWKLHGAMNTQYMQVGNAVPVHLGAAIGKAVLAHEAAAAVETVKAEWKPDLELMIATAIGRLRAAGRNKKSLARAA